MKKLIPLIIVIAIGLYNFISHEKSNENDITVPKAKTVAYIQNNTKIINAFKKKQSDIQIKGFGTVVHILRDDIKGSKHQKFILEIAPHLTILIAHNIDLAPRINSLRKGDIIKFYGEYEYNNKGGVVHWTHHDPRNKHISGWLKHNGRTYQ